MNILGDAPRYHAYLLRCWAERGQDGTGAVHWRCSLEASNRMDHLERRSYA